MLLIPEPTEVKNTLLPTTTQGTATISVHREACQKTLFYLEAYLLYFSFHKRDRKNECRRFFDRCLSDIDDQLSGKQVFLNHQLALQHARFMGNDCVVLKVYIPEAAVEGRSHGLVLRKGFITRSSVFSCFVKAKRQFVQYKNPYFDPRYLHTR